MLTECKQELSPVQQKAIIGVILGDGHLQKSGERSNTSLWMDNAYPSQKDFINNLRELFDSITTVSPKIVTRVDKRSNKTTESIRFWTRALPCLNYYHNIFYKDKVKIIPQNIGELLSEIGLAYWLMGDGFYRKDRGGVVLCTDSYTLKEVELLVETLVNKFGLSVSKHIRKKEVYRIYIHKKSIDALCGLVKPYFITSMLYKLGLDSNVVMKDSNVKIKSKVVINAPLAGTIPPSRRHYSTLLSRKSCTFINKINNEDKRIKCLKWLSNSNYSELNFMFMISHVQKRSFIWCSNKLKSHQRIAAVVSPPRKISMLKLASLHPSFVTRFADAEGCFMISIFRRTGYNLGWQIKPEFKITLHSKDLRLLEKIKAYFVVGNIVINDIKVSFEVKSFKDISDVIIPHFDLYPLISQKFADFLLFKSAVELISRKEHLTEEGLRKIVGIRSSLNRGLTPILKEAFPDIISVNRPLVQSVGIIDPNWVAGFISGFSTTSIILSAKGVSPLNPRFLKAKFSTNHILNKKWIKQFTTKVKASTNNSMSLVVWGSNLTSTVGEGTFPKQVRNMVKLPPYQKSVIVGLILSDGWLRFSSKNNKNAHLGFEQSLANSGYIWFLFYILSHYCNILPKYRLRNRGEKTHLSIEVVTRALPCFTKLYSLFYVNKVKVIPEEHIYNMLTPVALAHLIMGDGKVSRHGLVLCTYSYKLIEVIRLINVLIIRYRLECTLRYHTSTQPRIYIKERSMQLLRTVVRPHMCSTMLYKLGERVNIRHPYTTSCYKVFSSFSLSGCFFIHIAKHATASTGFTISSVFILAQHSRDKELIEKIKDYLLSGFIRIEKSMVSLRVGKFSDITDKIIPFFDKHPVQGVKYLDYLDFKRVVELMKNKAHLTPEGLSKIRNIKEKMNTGRDYLKFIEDSSIESLIKEPESSTLGSNFLGKKRNTLGGITQKRSFWSNRLKSGERIGPHNLNIISLILGSLLSSSYLEKRSDESGAGVRIIFIKYSNNVEYIMWFFKTLAKAGYCSYNKPKLYRIIGKGNKVLFFYVLKSYSFSSFTWLFSLFYRNNLKIIPLNLYEYITPLSLATLFLSSAWAEEKAIFMSQARLNTSLSCSNVKGLNNLSQVLKNKYTIETEIKKNSDLNIGSLYIKNSSRAAFTKVVEQHILPSQYHLLNKPTLKLTLFGTSQFKRNLATIPDLSYLRNSKRKLRKEYILSLEQKEAQSPTRNENILNPLFCIRFLWCWRLFYY